MAKSAIGSAFGFLSTITTRISSGMKLRQAEDAVLNLSEDTIKQLTDEFVQTLIIKATGVAENCFRVIVDYGQTLQQMIANGKYDYADSDINSDNFPMTGPSTSSGQATKQDVVIELVSFKGTMKSEAVLKELKARGLRAATLPELLAFGATYPEKQRGLPIIALDPMWQDCGGSRSMPCLDGSGLERELDLYRDDCGWDDHCWFAAVRKSA